LWKLQVLPAIQGAQLVRFIDGSSPAPPEEIKTGTGDDAKKEPNPAYATWLALDQQVFSYIVTSLTKDVLKQVATCATAAQLWKSLEEMGASQTRACKVNTRIALATTKKGSMTVDEYVGKMRSLADEMASAGKPIDDEELVSHICTGLDIEFNLVVSAILVHVEPISMTELATQLNAFEQRMDLLHGSSSSSANLASRGRGNGRGNRGRGGRGRGNGPSGRGRGNFNSNSNKPKPRCQVCKKDGHTMIDCWYRFDESFVAPEEKSANIVAHGGYGVDSNWYSDTGAIDHVTGELDKMMIRDRYNGGEQIHMANGSGMDITHVGRVICHTPERNLFLNNVLYVPSTTKNLVSVHRLASDNNAYFEFHPNHFLIKDQTTKRTLLEGTCKGGLYPLPVAALRNKQVLSVSSGAHPSLERWHHRLGHPSFHIVQQVINKNKLSCSSESKVGSVCDSCQMAKSHQLPYPKSSSQSNFPLELVFSNVWGPTCDSFGRNKYYVSFIDDYSKFTWIYLLKHKSEVFQPFHEFQGLIERQFDRKIFALQPDWGGEYEKLNSFSTKTGIVHLVSCPHAHQQNGAAERKHRHIVEVGLSLLAQSSMPLKYWDQAFLTATYLINRTPNKVINNSTPLERLYKMQIDYTSLSVFGCACWPNLRPYNSHKLAFRSKQCAFLGYTNLHKGFKCLDIASGCVYIYHAMWFLMRAFFLLLS
jgi:histone deacetylase 1/2